MSIKYRPEIDGLRALAALSVVIFHVNKDLLPGGFLGVDIFFVISGFLISSIIMRQVEAGTWSFKSFYIKRLKRLAPAMMVVCLLTPIFALAILGPSQLVATAKSAFYSVLYVSNFQYWIESGYFDSGAIYKPLLHTWSLSVEEQFYLIWPALILLALKFSKKVLPVLFSLLFILSLAASYFYENTDGAAVFFLMPFRIYEFAIGALLIFVLPRTPISALSGNLLRVIGTSLIVVPMFILAGDMPRLQLWALLACLGTCLIIYSGVSGATQTVFTNKVSLYFGKISYSLYLVHWPLISLVFIATFQPFGVVLQLALLVASVILGAMLYEWIEKPLRYGKRQKRVDGTIEPSTKAPENPLGPIVLWLSGTLATVVLATHLWVFDGIPARTNQDTFQMIETRMDNTALCFKLRDNQKPDGFQTPCKMGQRNAPMNTLVAIGDSHGNALVPGLSEYLASRRLGGLADNKAGTTPLAGISSYRYESERAHNQKIIEDMIGGARDLKPKAVVITSRWMLKYYLEYPGLESGPIDHLDFKDAPRGRSVETSRAALKFGLINTVNFFKDQDIDVIIVGQVPHLGINPVECMTRPTKPFGFSPESCSYFTAQQWRERAAPVDKFFEDALEEAGHGIYISGTDAFCGEDDQCKIIDDGKMLYRDDDHLSPHGAKFFVSKFENELDKILGVRPPKARPAK